MPFRSQAQWNWAFATDQEFADEWAKLTPGGKRRYELLRRRVEKKQSLKHLPGKHDQRKHGRRGNGGGSSGSASSASLEETVAWNDSARKEINSWALELYDAWPVQYNVEELARAKKALVDYAETMSEKDKTIAIQSSDVTIALIQRAGIPIDDAVMMLQTPSSWNSGYISTQMSTATVMARLSRHHQELGVRVSNMNETQQRAFLDEIISRSKSPSYSQWDTDTAANLALYASPNVRWDAMVYTIGAKYSDDIRYVGGRAIGAGRPDVETAGQIVKFYSLDYRLHNAMTLAGVNPSKYGKVPDKVFSEFMKRFTFTHSSENTNNILGAQIQHAMSFVGPNAGNATRSFYLPGVKAPEPNPEVLRFLNMQYEKAQREYADTKLYRGTKKGFAVGIPMSPWSPVKEVAGSFAGNGGTVNETVMPAKYIFMSYNDRNFITQYKSEQEYLILESGFRANNSSFRADESREVWTSKEYDGRTEPKNSYLEQSYNIFYNYMENSNASTRREKAVARMKHLPGKHDQRKHGRNGGGGSGGGSASTKPLSELSTDELITLLDDPSQYDSEAYAVSKAGVDLVREYLKNDELAQQFVRDIGLDMNDPDTPSIVAGLFSIVGNPQPNQYVELRSNGLDGYSQYVSKEKKWQTPSKTNKGIENYATFTVEDSILNITNNTFFNSSDIRGMGYTVRRQQILAAQLYKQKTGRDVRINATAVSSKDYSLNGAHTWPFVGYNFVFNDAFSGHMKSYGFDAGDSYSLFKQRNSDGKTGAEMYRTMLDDWILPGEEFSIHGRLYATEPQGIDGLEILVGYGRKKYGSKTKAYVGDVNMNNSDLDDTDIAILIDLWNAKVPPKKLTRREKALVRFKHLPGRHNQQSHGRRRGGGGSSAGETIGKFNAWNQREIARIEETMERVGRVLYGNAPVSTFTQDEIAQLEILAIGSGLKNFDVFLEDAQKHGLTADEVQTIMRHTLSNKSKYVDGWALTPRIAATALLSDHYKEQRIRISQMDKDTQQQMLDDISSIPRKQRTLWDYDRAAALTIYADPEVRWNAIQFMFSNEYDAGRVREVSGFETSDTSVGIRSAWGTMEYYSLDYRLYDTLKKTKGDVSYSELLGSSTEDSFQRFMKAFSFTHTSQNTSNVLGAQIQYAISQIGPNANAPRPPSFFPRGVNTPTSNPEVQRLLNMQYQETQRRISTDDAILYDEPNTLYRGQRPDFNIGIPMGPWSDVKSVAVGFATEVDGGNLNITQMPREFIFMDHRDPNWQTKYSFEKEYLILETAFVRKSRSKKVGKMTNPTGGRQYEEVEWTEKAMTSQIPEPNSYLEDQYDIFYNYRKKPKKPKRTRREKAVARMKADFEARGNTPGRRWSAGAGEVISGDLARDDAGRFASASGGGRARRAVEVTNQILERQGGAKPKKKKPTKAPRDVEQERRDSEAKRRAAGEEGMEAVGFKKEDFAFVDSNEAKDPNDKTVQRLIADGLMEEVNGKAYPTAFGRRLAKAVARGEYGTAQEIVDRYEDKKKRSEESTKEEGFSPPSGVRSAARRGLELRSEFGRGGTAIGVARARDLSNGKSIPLKTIKRMVSFFARHAVDKRPNWSDPSNPTNGYIAHLLWGGDAGRSWANSIAKRMEGKE